MESPLLIATRFGVGIDDPAWFEHRIELFASITASSLAAQDDQNFEWAVFVGTGMPRKVREELEHVLAGFGGRAYVGTGGHNPESLLALAESRELAGPDGYLFTGRIDDDDAWDRGTISAVRRRIAAWREEGGSTRGFCMTFKDGLVWIMYDMIDVDHLQKKQSRVICKASVRPYSYPFTSISGFVYSRLSDRLTSISTGHPKLGEYLEERGFAVESIATDDPMWLYCRHKQTTSPVQRATEAEVLDLSLSELKRRFGIADVGVRQYVEGAYSHDYSRIGHWEFRSKLRTTLKETHRRMADPQASKGEIVALQSESDKLVRELKELSENVMFGLEQTDY